MATPSVVDVVDEPVAYSSCVVTVKLSAEAVMKLREMKLKGTPQENRTFHLFGKLPPELRLMIWRYAVYAQNRVVGFKRSPVCHTPNPADYEGSDIHFDPNIYFDDRNYFLDSIYFDTISPVPPLFLTCKEAYFEARKFYTHWPPEITWATAPTSSGPGPWLSFENDIFLLMCSEGELWRIFNDNENESELVSLDMLAEGGSRRLAIRKEAVAHSKYCINPDEYNIGAFAVIELTAARATVDEMWVIDDQDNRVVLTREEMGPAEVAMQRTFDRSVRNGRFWQRLLVAEWAAGPRAKGVIARRTWKWYRGIAEQDLEHDLQRYGVKGGDAMWDVPVRKSWHGTYLKLLIARLREAIGLRKPSTLVRASFISDKPEPSQLIPVLCWGVTLFLPVWSMVKWSRLRRL